MRTSLEGPYLPATLANIKAAYLLPRSLYRRYGHDPVYRSSLIIIASSVITSLLGFFFWIACARLYQSYEVGLATALISSISLISTFSLLGYNTALIRYMYHSQDQTERVNTSLTIVSALTILASLLFILLLRHFSERLVFIQDSIWLALAFVVSAVLMTLYLMLESVFIATQRAGALLLKNSSFSLTKLSAVPLVTALGATGIFLANSLGAGVAVAIGLLVVVLRMGHRVRPYFDRNLAREMSGFAAVNYAATAVESAPFLLLPLLITNGLGPALSAYFYIDVMIAGAIYTIPIAVSQVVLAHSSRHRSQLLSAVRRAIRLTAVLLLPSIVLIVLFGEEILHVFGEEYAENGYTTLVLLICSAIPISAKALTNAIFNVEHKVALIVTTNASTAVVVILLSLVLMGRGLAWVGVAWLVGETFGAIVALTLVLRRSITFASGTRARARNTATGADACDARETKRL